MKLLSIYLLFLTVLLVSCSQQLSTEEYIQNGQKHASRKEWKSAVIEYKNAIKQSPENADARVLLGKVYLKLHNSNAAIIEFNKAIKLGQIQSKLLLNLARAYEQLGQFDKILSEVNFSGVLDGQSEASLRAFRAKAYLHGSKQEEAKKELDEASAIDEKNTDVRLAWSLYEKSKGNLKKQRLWLTPLLEEGKDVAEAWSEIASLEQLEGKYDEAEIAFSTAISIRNFVHLDNIKRAFLRISQKNYDGAKADIDLLISSGVKWPMVSHAKGLIAYHNEQYDEAQSIFEKVLLSYPDYTPSQLFLGLTYFTKGNYQSAVNKLEPYLAQHPSVLQAQIAYSISSLKLGKPDEAIKVLVPLSAKLPDNFKITSLLGSAYIGNKEIDKGIKTLRKAASLKNDDVNVHLQLGMSLIGSGKSSNVVEGKKELLKALSIDPELVQANTTLYRVYMSENDFEKARITAQKIFTKQKDSSLGQNLLALTFLAEKNTQAAVDSLKATLKVFPFDPLTSSNLARIYLRENKLSQAKNLYEGVLSKKANDLTSLTQMALIAAREKNSDEMINWLIKAVDLNPDESSPKMLLATQYLRKNGAKQAVSVLQGVKQDDKFLPSYVLLLAKAKIGVNEYQHAIRGLNALIARQPDMTAAHFLMAQAYGLQNRPKKMRKSLETTIKLVPDHLAAHIILARLDLRERRYESFKKKVTFLIKVYPENKDVQFLNAKIESSDKGFNEAIETLSSLMKTTPHSEVIIDLARNYWVSGNKNAAISNLELWIQDHPDDRNALAVLAQFYLAENRESDAMSTYQSLDSILPDNAVVLNNLAWLMLNTDVKQGIVFAERALKLEPENPYILDTIAMLRLKNDELGKALIVARKAAKAAPNSLDIQINYAKVLSASARKEEARSLLNKLLSKVKADTHKKQIQQALEEL